ncbi:unnamed protein product [Alopecurus aequalis]
MFPSECLLDRRVRSDGYHQDLDDTNLPLFILRCEDRKADGYAGDKLELYNQRLNDMVIGVRLADAPPDVSYLTILGALLSAEIVAVDKTVIVIRLAFTREGATPSPRSYLIYDAVALSLRMIPASPQDPSWAYTISSSVSLARPCRGPDYALVLTGRLGAGGEKSFFLWRPSSSLPPWSECKKAALLDHNGCSETKTSMPFSFNGHIYRVDLLRGAFCSVNKISSKFRPKFCFSCDALFDDKSSSVAKFIHLPVEPGRYHQRIAEPAAYRTMGVVGDSFIRFVSIDGFHEYVELKDRTVTVWKLVGHDNGWEKEHELSLETLWGFQGFGDLSKELTPMYPLLSTIDTDVVYLGLGNYHETKIIGGLSISTVGVLAILPALHARR